MSRLRRSVPSLGALAAFEAAARLGGFTKAAGELGVTQAAISRQIRVLETDLGKPLFVRGNRVVELTAAGRLLAEAVSESFTRMASAIDEIREGRDLTTLTVSTSLAFSHFWLLPRLPSFRVAHPDVKLSVLSSDYAVDLRLGEADVAIRYGKPPFRDGHSVASLPEIAYPVASPALVERLPHPITSDTLNHLPLIEGEPRERQWLSWPKWFALAGIDAIPRRGILTFNHYSDAVYAAITGEGVILGWHRLLERPLGDGRLTRVGDVQVEIEEAHHVVVASDKLDLPTVGAFVEWITAGFDGCA
ncbi:LysR substrate-binding domain-containing protein [Acuticoccus yangtzensis]|uniref:LysR substrate-binding domain-containing protein n=1 Tax=Acuticoccus yangtzensis TaxID=1443441 RepID=UPI000949542D|nr:LysR substrate-binding domain-containing protein [Acuticoccus yangtzensis]ORE94162.1 LysR family transcriptional regulator [Stappia sp. 22II-S9-Z10]